MTPTSGVGGDFLAQTREDLADAYAYAAGQLDKVETAVEKDVWVCWTLKALFECPGLPAMAFKGGTSLSKAFDAIKRFSEDVDITMHFPDHGDPYDASLSRRQRDAMDDLLAAAMRTASTETLLPYLSAQAENVGAAVRAEQGGEVLWVDYPSVLDQRDDYYKEGVKIEFGARAGIDPSQPRKLQPYIAKLLPQFTYPEPVANVLAPERTFWEKYTLAHAESVRTNFKSPERFSRHWYDLHVLADHEIGRNAISDLDLLDHVIKMKKRFFATGGADYDDCRIGAACILPESGERLDALEQDYINMVDAGMLEDDIPAFADIITRLKALEDEVNTAAKAAPPNPSAASQG